MIDARTVADNAVLQAMGTSRAVRQFKTDPVSEELLETLVWAATRAPSPMNLQPWCFVVVTDRGVLQAVADLLPGPDSLPDPATAKDEEERRTYVGARDLAGSFATVPAIIFVCLRRLRYSERQEEAGVGLSAVFTAAENILVAARSLGLGAAFTTFHSRGGAELRELLGLPERYEIKVTIPIGWPARQVSAVSRRPVEEVLHWQRFVDR